MAVIGCEEKNEQAEPSDAEIRKRLTEITGEATKYWDARGEPYPEHLRAALEYLESRKFT